MGKVIVGFKIICSSSLNMSKNLTHKQIVLDQMLYPLNGKDKFLGGFIQHLKI